MARTEDIEAKLAAYVDGELDEAGRAEIEKHLATNPQHAQLIRELTRQREFVRELPREMAPADVAEQIHAQLERAALLGSNFDDETEAASLRINRWPQIRAIAAVLVLTAGLSIIVYYVLPSPSQRAPEIAQLLPPPTTAESESLAKSDADNAEERAKAETSAPALSTVSPARETDQERRAKDALAVAPTPPTEMPGVSSNAMPPGDRMFKEVVTDETKLGKAGPADAVQQRAPAASSPLVVVIPSDNPDDTNTKLKQYFVDNNISWQAKTEPMPEPLNIGPQQEVMASRNRSTNVQWKQGAAPPAGGFGGTSTSTAPINGQVTQAPINGKMPSHELTQQSMQQPGQQPAYGFNDNSQRQQQLAMQQQFVCRVTVQQANELKNAFNGQAGLAVTQNDLTYKAQDQLNRELEDKSKLPNGAYGAQSEAIASPTSQPAIDVAAGETNFSSGKKLDDVRKESQPAMIKTLPENGALAATTAPSAPSTAPAAAQERRIALGDTLNISVPKLGTNGSALSQPVSSTGTVTPPMLESFDVRGMTTDQASEAITKKYRDAKLIPEDAAAQVTLSPAQTAATPMSVAANGTPNDVKQELEKEGEQQVQQIQPSQKQSALALNSTATSQPALADDMVDVVIVVQSTAPQMPAGAATQPANAAEQVQQPAQTQPQPAPTTGPAQ